LRIFTLSLAIALVSFGALFGDPWGKDADLAFPKSNTKQKSLCTPILSPVAESLIRFHQEVISPADGPRSHYFPSSSQYTLDAIRKYGFFKGVAFGCDRLMRENSDPWVYRFTTGKDGKTIKSNPVP
jgi:putative component of membrane protein insertase Oxa1/YidC/SpoIIIJ protein YidD